MANDCAQQRFAAMQATIDELRAKVQAREPIGRPSIDSPWIGPLGERAAQKLELAKKAMEQAKNRTDQWQKAAQPDLFPSHRPVARGYVDPNRPDQAKAHQAMFIPPLGKALSASVDGKQLSTAESRNLIDRLWNNAQATQAQADRDGENLKK